MELTEDERKMQVLPQNRRVTVTFHDNIAVVEMNYGENRINAAFIQDLQQALDQVEKNPKVEVMITCGKGKFYSNGFDIKFMGYLSEKNRLLEFRKTMVYPLYKRLLTFPVPTIAAINGHCFAAGGVLALLHDYRIMQSGRGWFCLNEVRLGTWFSPFTQNLMRFKIPSGPAMHNVGIMGKRFTAEEALEAGLAASVCRPTELMEHSLEFARSLLRDEGSYNREHLASMKKQVYSEALDQPTAYTTSVFAELAAKL